MHNLHIAIVAAASSNDAELIVEDFLHHCHDLTENNWFSILGSIQEGKILEKPIWGVKSFEDINENVRGYLETPLNSYQIELIQRSIFEGIGNLSSLDLYLMRDAFSDLYQSKKTIELLKTDSTEEKFDCISHEYKPYKFTEFGITHLGYNEGDIYAVLIDMHS